MKASSPAYNDVDWYKFTATSTDRYEITCSNVDILKHPMHFEIWSTEDYMENDRVITNNEGWLEEKNELSASTDKTPVKVTAGTKKLTISWKALEGADGYIIYRSTSKNGTYKKIATITDASQLSYVNKRLTTGKTYYYQVKAYTHVGESTYYSEASTSVGKTVK